MYATTLSDTDSSNSDSEESCDKKGNYSKKLNEVLAHQNPFSDKSGLGYIGESNSSVKVSKNMKFVKAKEPMMAIATSEKVKAEKKRNVTDQQFLTKPPNQSVVKPKGKGKSLPKSQRGPRTQRFCHHCGIKEHTKPNFHKLKALKNAITQRSGGPRNDRRNWTAEQSKSHEGVSGVRDVMKMIDAFTTYLISFTRRFESHNNRTQSFRDVTPKASVMWVKKDTHA